VWFRRCGLHRRRGHYILGYNRPNSFADRLEYPELRVAGLPRLDTHDAPNSFFGHPKFFCESGLLPPIGVHCPQQSDGWIVEFCGWAPLSTKTAPEAHHVFAILLRRAPLQMHRIAASTCAVVANEVIGLGFRERLLAVCEAGHFDMRGGCFAVYPKTAITIRATPVRPNQALCAGMIFVVVQPLLRLA